MVVCSAEFSGSKMCKDPKMSAIYLLKLQTIAVRLYKRKRTFTYASVYLRRVAKQAINL